MTKTLSSNDERFLKYAKLEIKPDGLNEIFKFIEDNDDDADFNVALATFVYETDDGDEIDDILKAIEETYKKNSEELNKEIMLSLKDKPELRNRLDIRSTLRLSRYEGSASNVLRDIMMTSNSMIQEITSKRVILQESIRQDEIIVNTIRKDNTLIVKYLKELGDIEEIEKKYWESFEKVVKNMGKINTFVNES